jgi:hypothetical protein
MAACAAGLVYQRSIVPSVTNIAKIPEKTTVPIMFSNMVYTLELWPLARPVWSYGRLRGRFNLANEIWVIGNTKLRGQLAQLGLLCFT